MDAKSQVLIVRSVISAPTAPQKNASEFSVCGFIKDFIIVGKNAIKFAAKLNNIARLPSPLINQAIIPTKDSKPQNTSKVVILQEASLFTNEDINIAVVNKARTRVIRDEVMLAFSASIAMNMIIAITETINQVTLFGLVFPFNVPIM